MPSNDAVTGKVVDGAKLMTTVEQLAKAMTRAEPLPWVWEQCGEKEDAPVVGVAFDVDDKPLSGRLDNYGDEIMRFNIASDWGSGIDASAPSANAAFVVEAVNALPPLLAAARENITLHERIAELEREVGRKDAALRWWDDQASAWYNSRVPNAKPGWMQPAIDKGRAALSEQPSDQGDG